MTRPLVHAQTWLCSEPRRSRNEVAAGQVVDADDLESGDLLRHIRHTCQPCQPTRGRGADAMFMADLDQPEWPTWHVSCLPKFPMSMCP